MFGAIAVNKVTTDKKKMKMLFYKEYKKKMGMVFYNLITDNALCNFFMFSVQKFHMSFKNSIIKIQNRVKKPKFYIKKLQIEVIINKIIVVF